MLQHGEQFLDDTKSNLTEIQKLQERFKKLNKRLRFPAYEMKNMVNLKRNVDFFIWSRTEETNRYKYCSLNTQSIRITEC